jgi:hypothetical protein
MIVFIYIFLNNFDYKLQQASISMRRNQAKVFAFITIVRYGSDIKVAIFISNRGVVQRSQTTS